MNFGNPGAPPGRGGNIEGPGTATVSSNHSGGAHVLMGDGAVVFITDSIDAGDVHAENIWLHGSGLSRPGKASPYGVWGAMGSRSGKELDEDMLID